MPKDVLRLQQHLGNDDGAWPKHCVIRVPLEIRADIDRVVEAVQVARANPQKAKSMIGLVNAEEMKRWFILESPETDFCQSHQNEKVNSNTNSPKTT